MTGVESTRASSDPEPAALARALLTGEGPAGGPKLTKREREDFVGFVLMVGLDSGRLMRLPPRLKRILGGFAQRAGIDKVQDQKAFNERLSAYFAKNPFSPQIKAVAQKMLAGRGAGGPSTPARSDADDFTGEG